MRPKWCHSHYIMTHIALAMLPLLIRYIIISHYAAILLRHYYCHYTHYLYLFIITLNIDHLLSYYYYIIEPLFLYMCHYARRRHEIIISSLYITFYRLRHTLRRILIIDSHYYYDTPSSSSPSISLITRRHTRIHWYHCWDILMSLQYATLTPLLTPPSSSITIISWCRHFHISASFITPFSSLPLLLLKVEISCFITLLSGCRFRPGCNGIAIVAVTHITLLQHWGLIASCCINTPLRHYATHCRHLYTHTQEQCGH